VKRRILAFGVIMSAVLAAFASRQDFPVDDIALADRPPIAGVATDLVTVNVDSVANTIDLVVGPVALPAGLPGLRVPIQLAELPVHGWLGGFAWHIRDVRGRVYSSELLHHFNLIDPDRRELFSPVARRVLAFGRETEGQQLPAFIGYPLQADTRFLLVTMFANPGSESIDSAYLHLTLDFIPYKRAIQPLPVFPFHLDVAGPVGEKDFPVPPGRTVKAWEGSPATDARILAISGHVHDYARMLRLEDVTTGEVLWAADFDTEAGHVTGVSRTMAWKRGGILLHANHRYRAVVEYENPSGEPTLHGGMGVIGGIALVRGSFPSFDRQNTDYATDLANVISAPQRAHAGHSHASHH